MAVVALVFAGQAIDYGLNGDTWAYAPFVADIKREVRPDGKVFMEDLSGRLALLSQRSFVSGDGLVNSNRYLHEFLVAGRVGDFLAQEHIDYFLTSNVQCYPYRKVMPWTRTVSLQANVYTVSVDVSYLTRLPITPSILTFPKESLRLDKCVNGLRLLLFALTNG